MRFKVNQDNKLIVWSNKRSLCLFVFWKPWDRRWTNMHECEKANRASEVQSLNVHKILKTYTSRCVRHSKIYFRRKFIWFCVFYLVFIAFVYLSWNFECVQNLKIATCVAQNILIIHSVLAHRHDHRPHTESVRFGMCVYNATEIDPLNLFEYRPLGFDAWFILII